MNIRHLHYFIEIVAAGNLRRASEVLYVTQSALSRAISDLESDLGCTLLERDQRGVRPTPQGLAFVRGARNVLESIESLRNGVLVESSEPAGHVRLAMSVGLRQCLTRPLVRRLRSEYPNVRVDIADGNAHENRAAVLEGMADIVVVQELNRGLPLNYRRLYVDPLCLVGPKAAGFSMARTLPQSALVGLPLLQIRAPNQIRWLVESTLRRLSAPTEPTMEVSSSVIQLDLVEDGHGYTVLPKSLLLEAVRHRGISAAPLSRLSVTWVAAWPKGKQPTRAVQIALETLLAVSAAVPASLRN